MGKALERPDLTQIAWNYLNDSLRTSLCCAFQPHLIALASVHLAARATGTKLPSKPPWWEAFDIDFKTLHEISRTIMAINRKQLPEYIYIPRKKKEIALPPDTPADTPAPAKSPSDDIDEMGVEEGEIVAPEAPVERKDDEKKKILAQKPRGKKKKKKKKKK